MGERHEKANGLTTDYNEKSWDQSWLYQYKSRFGKEKTITFEILIPKHEEVFWHKWSSLTSEVICHIHEGYWVV